MANRCAGLDPTWAHLPTPAPAHAAAASHYYCSSSPSWLASPAAAFENEALTSALRASMAPAHAYSASATAAAAAASSFSSPATPSSSTTSSASELLSSSGHDAAPAAAPAASSRPGGPRGGRVTKGKPRPSRASRRTQTTTYITADPANFRRMVQEITGLPVPAAGPSSFPAGAGSEAVPNWTPAPSCVLPTLDTSAFLLDRAAAAVPAAPEEDKSPAGGGHASSTATNDAAVAAAAGDHDSSALLELEALVCAAAGECGFAALDLESWGII